MEATKKAMVDQLNKALKAGVVTFQFKKKDGTIRTAKGTTNLGTINEVYSFKGGDGPSKHGYTSYWDVEKEDWRCFNENQLVAIL